MALFTEDLFSPRAKAFAASAVDPFAVSDLASAEFASVVSRLVRTGDMQPSHASMAFGSLDRWKVQAATEVETCSSDLRVAEGFMRRLEFSLRTPDAIHLATALRLDATLVTFDRRLERDARALGATVAAA